MRAQILSEFQKTQIRRHLGHGKGTRLVRVMASGEVHIRGRSDGSGHGGWQVVGRVEDVMREIDGKMPFVA